MGKTGMASKAALDRFLADNQELEQLSARMAEFNVFRALKIEKAEIRHSNTLGWLLDPAESHGLREIVLRRVLSNMLLESQAEVGVSAAEIELMAFRDVEVRREWKHIDVIVIDRGNNLVMLIENKVGSGESKQQLDRYRKAVKEEFPQFRLIPVFLTLDGIESSDQAATDYICYSHAQLLGVLERILEQRQAQLSEAVSVFLRHYMDTLRRLTMQDEALTQLCKTIYRKHREAINLIVEYGSEGSLEHVVCSILENEGGYEILAAEPQTVWFLPVAWAKVIPENGTAWKHLKRSVSIACWCTRWQNRIRLVFEICRMDQPKLRLSCVKALHKAGFKFTKKAFNEEAVFSRFYYACQNVTDPTDEDEVREAVEKLVGKGKEQFPKVLAVLEQVFHKTT